MRPWARASLAVLISAAIDTLAARADPYAPGEQYAGPAVAGYVTGIGMLFHGRPRLAMVCFPGKQPCCLRSCSQRKGDAADARGLHRVGTITSPDR